MTDTTEEVAPETDTDESVESVEPEAAAAAPAAAPKENNFPKVVKRDEDADITHYSPKAHEELDPSTRFTS